MALLLIKNIYIIFLRINNKHYINFLYEYIGSRSLFKMRIILYKDNISKINKLKIIILC